jgi:hypothetical protein
MLVLVGAAVALLGSMAHFWLMLRFWQSKTMPESREWMTIPAWIRYCKKIWRMAQNGRLPLLPVIFAIGGVPVGAVLILLGLSHAD